ILNQGAIDATITSAVDQVREQVRAAHDQASLLETAEPLDPGEARRLMEHPLPYWVERMTLAYLEAHGGSVARHCPTWTLTWPAARRVGERLLSDEVEVRGYVSGQEAGDAFVQARAAAVAHGHAIYQELVQTHRDRLTREREKGEYAFEARRRAVQRLGLPEV